MVVVTGFLGRVDLGSVSATVCGVFRGRNCIVSHGDVGSDGFVNVMSSVTFGFDFVPFSFFFFSAVLV